MALQTITQQRAKHALTAIDEKIHRGINESEFKAYIQQLPVMIHQNGLGQALAFYLSKGGTHLEIYKILENWLLTYTNLFDQQNKTDLMQAITHADMATYRMAQAEAQAYLHWLRHIVKAKITKDSE